MTGGLDHLWVFEEALLPCLMFLLLGLPERQHFQLHPWGFAALRRELRRGDLAMTSLRLGGLGGDSGAAFGSHKVYVRWAQC